MEDLYRVARLQIALEGREGCSIGRLWELISNELPIRGLKSLDNPKIKELIWRNGIVSHSRDILVFVSKKSCLVLRPPTEDAPEEYLEGMAHVPDISHVMGDLATANSYDPQLLASEAFREGVLGLYEAKTSRFKISETQMKTLEAIAKTREHGALQSRIARELGVEHKNFFFVINCLLSRDLITKNAIAVKKAHHTRGMPQHSSTNVLHLKHFAPAVVLHPCQSLKMIDEPDGLSVKSGKTAFQMNDDPKLISLICDTIWATEKKIVVEHDLKKKLGFSKKQGHRKWRRLQKKMQDSGLIKAFMGIVDGSEVMCIQQLITHQEWLEQLQLPKDMSPALNPEATVLVESTLDKQIYDMIYDAGAKGIKTTEIFNSLQLSSKVNGHRLQAMLSRQEVFVQIDNDGRSLVKRCFAKCFDPQSSLYNNVEDQRPTVQPEHNGSWMQEVMWAIEAGSVMAFPCIAEGPSNMETDCWQTRELEPENDAATALEPSGCSLPQLHPVDQDPFEAELLTAPEPDMTPEEANHVLYARTVMNRGEFRYQCLLKKIRNEKFILRNHVRGYLRDLELAAGYTNNRNGPERRCIIQLMNRLEKSIGAKRVMVSFPSKSTGAPRDVEVLVGPDIECTEDLLKEIRESNMFLDRTSRQSQIAYSRQKAREAPVTVNVQRLLPDHSQGSDRPLKRYITSEQIHGHHRLLDNGFIPSKMIRTKLLHYLICRMVGLGGFEPASALTAFNGSGAPHSSACADVAPTQDTFTENAACHQKATEDARPHPGNMIILSEASEDFMFTLEQLWNFMPLELFVQVVGTKVGVNGLEELCSQHQTLGDLPEDQKNLLFDETSTSRLSDLLGILCRMELVDSVVAASNLDAELTNCSQFVVFKTGTLEEPRSAVDEDVDKCIPQKVHEYNFVHPELLDHYWTRLEYVFTVMREKSYHCFPATKAPEVHSRTGWTALRLMSVAQWLELMHRMDKEKGTLDWTKCQEIAKDLNLDYSQVLKLSRERRKRHRSEKLNDGEGTRLKYGRRTRIPSTSSEKRRQEKNRIAERKIHLRRAKTTTVKSKQKKKLDLPVLPAWVQEDPSQSPNHDYNDEELLPGGASGYGMAQPLCRRQWTPEEDKQLLSAVYAWRCSTQLPKSGPKWKKMVCLPNASLQQCARRYASLRRVKKLEPVLEHMGHIAENMHISRLNRLSSCERTIEGDLIRTAELWGSTSKATELQVFNEDQSPRHPPVEDLRPSQADDIHQSSGSDISEQGQRLTGQKRKYDTAGLQETEHQGYFTLSSIPCEDVSGQMQLTVRGKDGNHGITEEQDEVVGSEHSFETDGYTADIHKISDQTAHDLSDPLDICIIKRGSRAALSPQCENLHLHNPSDPKRNAFDLLIQHGHPEDVEDLLRLQALVDEVVSEAPRVKKQRVETQRRSSYGAFMSARDVPDHVGLAIVANHKRLKQHCHAVWNRKRLEAVDGPVTLSVATVKELIISLLHSSERSEGTTEAMGEYLWKTYEEKDISQAFRLLHRQGWVVHGGSQKPLRLSRFFRTLNTSFPSDLFVKATRTADYLRSLGSPLTEPLPSGCMEEDGAILVTKDTGAIEGGFMACVTAWLANKSITICPVVEDEFQQHGRPSPDHDVELMKAYTFGGSSESLVSVRMLSSRQYPPSKPDCGERNSSTEPENSKKRKFSELLRDAKLPFSYVQVACSQEAREQAQIAFLDAVEGCNVGDHLLPGLANFLLSVVRAAASEGVAIEDIHLQALNLFGDKATLDTIGTMVGKACWFELLQRVPGYDRIFYVASEYAGKFMVLKHVVDTTKEPEALCNQQQLQSLLGVHADEDVVALGGNSSQPVEAARAPTPSIHFIPACPWVDHKGAINTGMLKLLQERLLAAMVASPGISCESLSEKVGFVNPATAASLLEKMVQQGLCTVRTVKEEIPGPPSFFSTGPEIVIKTFYFPELLKCFSVEYPHLPGMG